MTDWAGSEVGTVEADTVSWGMPGRTILEEVSVRSVRGGVLGILGPNGSGKTTLLRLLAGQLRPTTGRVSLDGHPLSQMSRREIARRVAVLEQHSATDDDLSVRDVIDLGRIPHRALWSGGSDEDREVVERSADRTGVAALLSRQWRTLSGGEQQRVQLARAFAQQTGLLLLDEPTNHLDIRAQLHILALARAAPMSVVAALHDLDLAAMFCDQIVLLQEGRLVAAGRPADVITPEAISEVYGVDAEVDETDHGITVRFLPPRVTWDAPAPAPPASLLRPVSRGRGGADNGRRRWPRRSRGR